VLLLLSDTTIDVPSQFDEDSLHGVLSLPLGEAGQLARVDDTVVGVDTRKVDLADELDRRRLVGVFRTAVHLDTVDSVLVGGLKQRQLAIAPSESGTL
jgi:hypothetical protein